MKSSMTSSPCRSGISQNGRIKGRYLQRKSTILMQPSSDITMSEGAEERLKEMEEKMLQAKKNHSVEVSDLKVKIHMLCKDKESISV